MPSNPKCITASRQALTLDLQPRATRAWVDELKATLWVELVDGRTLGVPTAWFPSLEDATADERADVRVERDGHALRWEKLDEDLAVPHLLGLPY